MRTIGETSVTVQKDYDIPSWGTQSRIGYMKLSLGLKKLVWSWMLQHGPEVHAISLNESQRKKENTDNLTDKKINSQGYYLDRCYQVCTSPSGGWHLYKQHMVTWF